MNAKPKFQLSWTTDVVKGGMCVVTGDTITEFKEALQQMLPYIRDWENLNRANGSSIQASVKPQPVQQTTNGLGPCPQCGNGLKKDTTKNGKAMIKCSTNTWNKNTRQAEGCSYVKWL